MKNLFLRPPYPCVFAVIVGLGIMIPASFVAHAEDAAEQDAAVADTAQWSWPVQEGDCLSMLSLEIYGTSKRWQKIAEWNGIPAPFTIYPGQKLALHEPPTSPNLELKSPEALVIEAQQILDQPDGGREEAENARSIAERVRVRDPNLVSPWLLEIQALRKLGKTVEADALLDQLRKVHPQLNEIPQLDSASLQE